MMILARFRTGVVLLALSGTGAAQEFDSIVVSTEMVAMRDGVKLATDVYRPARGNQVVNEKLPVLVGRTPYNKTELRMGGEYLARCGFVVVAQDVRGRFASEGEFYAFINEGKDGSTRLSGPRGNRGRTAQWERTAGRTSRGTNITPPCTNHPTSRQCSPW